MDGQGKKNRETNLTLTEKKKGKKINFHFHFLSTLSFFVKVRNSIGFKTAKLSRSFSASKGKFPTPPFFACPNVTRDCKYVSTIPVIEFVFEGYKIA